ncbi:MAG TPA: SDR family NAD(P)-dependent oxidoreductase [Gammaproteobacteria bacterium]|nr:SDR family NAD(P)-dependent oxidoreductase [Gammaproteobacteria bacterium]
MQNPYKIALVTGASSGIGLEVARTFAQRGFNLALLARRRDRLEKLAAELSGHTSCHVMACDINDGAAVEREITALPRDFSTIDILINNAGLSLGLDRAHEASWDDWQRMIDTNCKSLAFMTHLLVPGMVARNRGHIVNIGSVAGSYAYRGGNVYGATKAFVEQFSRNLKADLLGTAVRVTNIEPGMTTDSEFSLVRFHGNEQEANRVYQGTVPMTAADIAAAVDWVIAQPAHVNINRIEMMPVSQAPGGLAVHRK